MRERVRKLRHVQIALAVILAERGDEGVHIGHCTLAVVPDGHLPGHGRVGHQSVWQLVGHGVAPVTTLSNILFTCKT